jgi:hypothetical protein
MGITALVHTWASEVVLELFCHLLLENWLFVYLFGSFAFDLQTRRSTGTTGGLKNPLKKKKISPKSSFQDNTRRGS